VDDELIVIPVDPITNSSTSGIDLDGVRALYWRIIAHVLLLSQPLLQYETCEG
jgi:hypothetical protein